MLAPPTEGAVNIPTCYRCPERMKDGKRCEILQGKLDAVKGAGVTSIRFKCDRRVAIPCLVAPGDVVVFEIYEKGCPDEMQCRGIVMRTWLAGEKVLLYVEPEAGEYGETEYPVIKLRPEHLCKTGEVHPVCTECYRPKGKTFKIRSAHDPEEREWMYCGLEGEDDRCTYAGPSAEPATRKELPF